MCYIILEKYPIKNEVIVHVTKNKLFDTFYWIQ